MKKNRAHVFPSDRNPRTHANASTANMALKRMGFGGVLVAHGLIALASTTLNEQSFDPEMIEAALAHIGNNEVRHAYNRANNVERRIPLMNWWSERIEQTATGNMSPYWHQSTESGEFPSHAKPVLAFAGTTRRR
jgi:integrase